jgi:hypothetical protein
MTESEIPLASERAPARGAPTTAGAQPNAKQMTESEIPGIGMDAQQMTESEVHRYENVCQTNDVIVITLASERAPARGAPTVAGAQRNAKQMTES